MNGAVYFADVAEGQKTGIFYDQRPNHKFVQDLAQGKSVLDVFSHVGGFWFGGHGQWRGLCHLCGWLSAGFELWQAAVLWPRGLKHPLKRSRAMRLM